MKVALNDLRAQSEEKGWHQYHGLVSGRRPESDKNGWPTSLAASACTSDPCRE